MMLAITNCTIVMKDHYIPNGTILTENGKIIDFGKKLQIPEGAEILDANGNFAGPGLVDIHTHAAGMDYFHIEPAKCSKMLLEHGVTSVLPALYYSLNKKDHLDAIEKIKENINNLDLIPKLTDAKKKSIYNSILKYYESNETIIKLFYTPKDEQ